MRPLAGSSADDDEAFGDWTPRAAVFESPVSIDIESKGITILEHHRLCPFACLLSSRRRYVAGGVNSRPVRDEVQ